MEGYGPIANQRMNTEASIHLSTGEYKTLPCGAYVKYIKKEYLPRDSFSGYNYDEESTIAVYSQFGLGLVNRQCVDLRVF